MTGLHLSWSGEETKRESTFLLTGFTNDVTYDVTKPRRAKSKYNYCHIISNVFSYLLIYEFKDVLITNCVILISCLKNQILTAKI